jgi:organic radical activating enzyme
MWIKQLIDEDFVNYKKPSMFIAFPSCTFKCEKECGEHCCQNSALAQANDVHVSINSLIERYKNNPITKAVVCGGLEPFDSWRDLQYFIMSFRYRCLDDIVIYTGYKEEEILDKIEWLDSYGPIIVKFGRFVPNQQPHYDEVLGVKLASDNQYAKVVSE